MMSYLRRLLLSDIEPTLSEQARATESERRLDAERGEYRQAVSRVEVGTRVMRAWENANRMVKE